jgi:two-component system sensor histidine kinase DesK
MMPIGRMLAEGPNMIDKLRHILSPQQPWLYLVYLGMFFFRWPYAPPTIQEAAWSIAAVTGFILMYVYVMRRQDWTVLPAAGVSIVLGFIFAPSNLGGAVFLVFSAAMLGRSRQPNIRNLGLAAWAVMTMIAGYWGGLSSLFIASALGFGAMAAIASAWSVHREQKEALTEQRQIEAASIAAEAERRRIARDLHDLLGHTLSVVTLKADIASRVFDSDPQKSQAELVEIQRVSRDALSQVREAVTGLRTRQFDDAIAEVCEHLRAAGLSVTTDIQPASLSANRATALAMMLREASTNILRHAKARQVNISYQDAGDSCSLSIADDGIGGARLEAGGLSDLESRLDDVSGTLSLASGPDGKGTVLTARFGPRET